MEDETRHRETKQGQHARRNWNEWASERMWGQGERQTKRQTTPNRVIQAHKARDSLMGGM